MNPIDYNVQQAVIQGANTGIISSISQQALIPKQTKTQTQNRLDNRSISAGKIPSYNEKSVKQLKMRDYFINIREKNTNQSLVIAQS